MKRVAFDTETFLLNQVGKATTKTIPRLVCVSVAEEDAEPFVLERERGVPAVKALLERDDCEIIGHNVVFDLLVCLRAIEEDLDEDLLPRVFDLYDAGRVKDTLVREKLLDIAEGGCYRRGGYGLKDLVKRRLGEKVKGKSGPDAWRMRYNELDGVPAENYPAAAYEYALLDAVYTLEVAKDQGRHVTNEDFQAAADFCLSLASAWGLKVDAEYAALIDGWYARLEDHALRHLVRLGLAEASGRIPQKSKRLLVEKAFIDIGEPPKLTATGLVSCASDTMRYLEEKGYEDEAGAFTALQDYSRSRKFRSTYLQPLLNAGEAGQPLCPRFNVLVDSGRTSSSGPNIQNFVSRLNPKERVALRWFHANHGKMSAAERLAHPEGFATGPDIRGSIVPREGKVFIGADYSAIEMAGLAQVIYNWTGEMPKLGASINAGEDQHLRIVAEMRGLSYDMCVELHEEYKAAVEEGRSPKDELIDLHRFCGKSANYSFPVGGSAATWLVQLKKMDIDMSLSEAEKVREAWFRAWPEMDYYFDRIGRMQMPGGDYFVEQHGPNGMTQGWRHRITDRFTSAANSLFQGIVADGSKYANWLIQKACYVEEDSPLYGGRLVIFEHDADYLEVDEDRAEEAGAELTRLMEEGMSLFICDVEVEAEYEIFEERWGK